MAKRKILIHTSGYFPAKKFGGPPVSIENMCYLLRGEAEFYIVALDHDLFEKEKLKGINPGWNNYANDVYVLYLNEKEITKKRVRGIFQEIEPDTVYVNSVFRYTGIPFLSEGKRKQCRIVIAPRGEFSPNVFKKKYKKIPYLALFRRLFKNDHVYYQATFDLEISYIEKTLGVSPNRIYCISNVPSLPKSESLSHRAKIGGKLRAIFISRILVNKNLSFALECVSKLNGKISFDIYGPIEDVEYWKKCQAIISGMDKEINVNYCGIAERSDIHRIFADHDIFIFPTFSENFGHVIAEALLSGCLVLLSNNTPWNDINSSGAGYALNLEVFDEWVKVLQQIVDMDDDEYNIHRNNIELYLDQKLQLDDLKKGYLAMLLP